MTDNPTDSTAVDEAAVARATAALMASRLSWGVHSDRWGDVEWLRGFFAEAAQVALAAAATVPDARESEDEATVVAATGNGMKSHDTYDTFLDVSGGSGNHADGAEVHFRIRSNDGHNEGQAWFPAAEVLAAVRRAAPNA